MKKNTLFGFFTIVFFSILLIGQTIAQDKASSLKNIAKFTSIPTNGNTKDVQGESTALITATNIGQTIGGLVNPYTGTNNNYWAGTFKGTIDGSNANFYCIDLGHYLVYNQAYTDEGSTPIEITYILNNYYPYKARPYTGSLSTDAKEASAVQAAIWHFADGLDVSTIGTLEIKNRVIAILADVAANAYSATYPDYFTITPEIRTIVDGEVASFTITAFAANGNPYEGLEINLSTTSGILSDAQVETDVNGQATFTVSQDGGNIAIVTANAQAIIPHGTQYFHVARPDGQQKLVLATPTSASASATAEVNWYTPGDCDLHNYTTFTIGGWGGPSNGGPGRIRDAHFDEVFPSGLVIGGNFTLTLTTAEAIKDFIPSGGTANALNQNYTNPTSPTSAGVLADQLLAATLNVYFHDAGFLGTNSTNLGDLVFNGGDFDGMSIYAFLTLANAAIGGTPNPNYSYSQINDAATKINENFDNGTVNKGYFTCAPEIPDCESTLGDFIWHDKNVNGIQDEGELGIENVSVELYDNNNTLISSTTTDNSGYYEFTNLANGNYKVKVADSNFGVGGVFENSVSEKWYLTTANQGSSDELDSDGDENKSALVTINCMDNNTVDFGFFHTEMTFIKSGPDQVTAGDLINYLFTVINTGDLVLHGGVSVYDPMLSNAGDGFLRNNVVQPGETWEFQASYTATADECGGNLVNNAWAIGHPQMPNGVYVDDIRYDDSHSVEVLCVQKASLGDRVWYDDDKDGIQDFGEDGVNLVTVNLYNCAAQFISSTTTNSDGYYLFENLEPGSYFVEFLLPNGYLFTSKNEGTDVESDSDADETNGKTECVTLVAGDNNLSLDAGIYTVPVNDFDLSIVKTASDTNPDDEEVITYTITVTNNSTTNGTGITVTDVLPNGLIYQSSSPAGYDTTTGIWTIGNLDAGDSKSLTISVKVDYLQMSQAPIFDLGIAAPYNLFVIKDAVQPSSDTEGKVAVGRNASFSNYSVGDKLPSSNGTEDVLVVGRKLTFISGQVYNGNAVYGKYKNIPQINLCSDGSIIKADSTHPLPVDFVQAEVELKALSSLLASKPVTGTTTFEWGGLTLDGNEPILNVFEIDGNDLSAANSMQINVPNGSVVLVNINRTDVSWTGGLVVSGTAIGNVIYNFHAAKNLYIRGIDVQGSILAPKATVNFASGVIHGQMLCKFFEGQGQMNLSPFHGSINGNPEITNCAEINSYDQVEVDLTNNISSVAVVVNVEFNPNNGDDSETGNNWVAVGTSGLNEMIWSMYQSSNGLLVGTVGGNIYRNVDNDFVLLNESMTVGYIWSLYEFNGNLFAGTESGLYKQEGSDWNKVNITGDVRSIISLDGVLYAAVWGGGVFSSNDNGSTWVAMNEGLVMSGYAVHSLTVANGNLFAGTFGLGVLRFDFDSNTWVELPVGYPFIWSLATDDNNTIYAATYGDGVYASIDNGENWGEINTGLPNMYAYSVSVFGNEVYVSTWAGGVYKFVVSSAGKAHSATPSVKSVPIVGDWTSIGMGGIEVSSIMVDETTQTVYAGTSTGAIYKKLDNTTDVNGDVVVPTEFALEQNYPNPFNPSTKIEFSIAKAGLYEIKVFNVLGQEVATIVNQDFSAGKYTFNFDASNLTSGIYFYKLVGNNVNMTKKMMLLK